MSRMRDNMAKQFSKMLRSLIRKGFEKRWVASGLHTQALSQITPMPLTLHIVVPCASPRCRI
jgi:hypothetical protein